jgi:hypothetical protein
MRRYYKVRMHTVIIILVVVLFCYLINDYVIEAFTNEEAIGNIAKLYDDKDMSVTNLTTTSSLTNKGATTLDGVATFKSGTSFKGGTGASGGTHFPYAGDNKNYIRGHTTLNGNLNVTGDLTGKTVSSVGGRVTNLEKNRARNDLACRYDYTTYNNRAKDNKGSVVYLDRHNASCNSNEFMQGIKLQSNGNNMRWRIKCCRFK